MWSRQPMDLGFTSAGFAQAENRYHRPSLSSKTKLASRNASVVQGLRNLVAMSGFPGTERRPELFQVDGLTISSH